MNASLLMMTGFSGMQLAKSRKLQVVRSMRGLTTVIIRNTKEAQLSLTRRTQHHIGLTKVAPLTFLEVQLIRGFTTMRYINRLFTYVLTNSPAARKRQYKKLLT